MTATCLITYGIIRSFAGGQWSCGEGKYRWYECAYGQPSRSLFTGFTASLWNVRHRLLSLSLLSVHICTYSLRHLCLVRSLSCSPSLPFPHNCLWSVPSEYQCAAVSLETVRTERQAGYSEGGFFLIYLFIFNDVGTVTSLVHVCMCGTCSEVCFWSFYLCELDKIHPVDRPARLCEMDAKLPAPAPLLALLTGSASGITAYSAS